MANYKRARHPASKDTHPFCALLWTRFDVPCNPARLGLTLPTKVLLHRRPTEHLQQKAMQESVVFG